ncbi:hypothetical protein BgiMline_030553, partial [Biomphalaria glabrata]
IWLSTQQPSSLTLVNNYPDTTGPTMTDVEVNVRSALLELDLGHNYILGMVRNKMDASQYDRVLDMDNGHLVGLKGRAMTSPVLI